MGMKGGRIFRFRDSQDFKSFYNEAERRERDNNMKLF